MNIMNPMTVTPEELALGQAASKLTTAMRLIWQIQEEIEADLNEKQLISIMDHCFGGCGAALMASLNILGLVDKGSAKLAITLPKNRTKDPMPDNAKAELVQMIKAVKGVSEDE